jgi:hypothetical protein
LAVSLRRRSGQLGYGDTQCGELIDIQLSVDEGFVYGLRRNGRLNIGNETGLEVTIHSSERQ